MNPSPMLDTPANQTTWFCSVPGGPPLAVDRCMTKLAAVSTEVLVRVHGGVQASNPDERKRARDIGARTGRAYVIGTGAWVGGVLGAWGGLGFGVVPGAALGAAAGELVDMTGLPGKVGRWAAGNAYDRNHAKR